jgi:hypothetical protein
MLLGAFAVQHGVMAWCGFKRWWTKLVPEPIERSTYALAGSLTLALLLRQWRPIAEPVLWSVEQTAAVSVLRAEVAKSRSDSVIPRLALQQDLRLLLGCQPNKACHRGAHQCGSLGHDGLLVSIHLEMEACGGRHRASTSRYGVLLYGLASPSE